MPDYNTVLIDELRSNGGEIAAGPMAGRPLLVLTTKGARTGLKREAVLTFTRDGNGHVVAGTAGGSPRTPSWVYNLIANPEVGVEAKGDAFKARAEVVNEPDRQRLWDFHVAARPEFAEYPAKARRVIPVIRLNPTSGR